MLAEMGIFAVISLLTVLGILFKSALYVYRREKDGFLKAFALGYMGIIPAIIVANMTGNRFTHVDLLTIFWIFSAAIICLKGIIQKERSEW